MQLNRSSQNFILIHFYNFTHIRIRKRLFSQILKNLDCVQIS